MSFKPGAVNPHGNFGQILPPNASKGSYRISIRYFIPKGNRAITGFQFVHGAGSAIGDKQFEETGKWVDEEVIGASSHETGAMLLYVGIAGGKKVADAVDDSIMLGSIKVEMMSFAAFVQKRLGVNGEVVENNTEPQKQSHFIDNGGFVEKP